MNNFKIVDKGWVSEPEVWGNHTNGGDYAFGEIEVSYGKKKAILQTTSSGFDFCQVTGTFTRTNRVGVEGTGLVFSIDSQIIGFDKPDTISIEEFFELLN